MEGKAGRSKHGARHRTKGASTDRGFEEFWKAYPRHVAKTAAAKAWVRLRPGVELVETILAAIERQKQTAQWTKDGGEYIPHPATWLNQRRWDDEVPQTQARDLSDLTGAGCSDEEAREALGLEPDLEAARV